MVEVHSRGDLSNNRPLALDGNPGDYFLAYLDRQYPPKHDERSSVFLVVNRLTFKTTTHLQSTGEPLDNLRVGSGALKDSWSSSDHRVRIMPGQFLERLVRVNDLSLRSCICDQNRIKAVFSQNFQECDASNLTTQNRI